MQLRNVTSIQKHAVNVVKAASPRKDSEVNIYEHQNTRFIHEVSGDGQVLSISKSYTPVTEDDWIIGVKKIMKLNLVDVMITVRPSGVVFIREKDDWFPKIANCTY